MYNVSEQYKAAILELTRTTKIEGIITLKNGTTIPFDDNDLLAGTFNIDNACVNGNEYMLGSAYLGQLKMTIFTDIDRYSLYDAEITVNFKLQLSSGDYESIPLGTYYIQEANRTGKTIAITAFDNMSKLDRDFSGIISGTALEMYNHILRSCGIEGGNTEQEIIDMAPKFESGNMIILRIDENTGIKTFRDLAADLSSTLGGFCTIDRAGRLKIRQFKQDTERITNDHIKKSTISDFVEKYDGVIATIGNTTYAAGAESGNILELNNELWNTGGEGEKKIIISNIWNKVKWDEYIPIVLEYDGDPAIDLGDEIVFNIGTETFSTVVMKSTFNYKGSHNISSVGSNPLLAKAKTKSSREFTELYDRIEGGFFNLINTESIRQETVNNSRRKILTMEVFTQEPTTVLLVGQIAMNVLNPSNIKITYENNKKLENWRPEQYLEAGKRIVNLYCPFYVSDVSTGSVIDIYIESDYTAGTAAEIDANSINATIFGNFAGVNSSSFTGVIRIEDDMPMIPIGGIEIYDSNETINKNIG